MYKKTLSATLNSEIKDLYPWNQSLVKIKRWTDTLSPLLRDFFHRLLHMYMQWWYEKEIYLHNRPVEEQVEIARRVYGGSDKRVIEVTTSEEYIWKYDDWHR